MPTNRKNIEEMSAAEVIEILPISVPFYTWRHAGIRSKLDQMARKGLVKKLKHRGFNEYVLPHAKHD